MKVDYSLTDLPTDRPSCANCGARGLFCARSSKIKRVSYGLTQHNGLIFQGKEVVGIIACCPYYTPIKTKKKRK